MKSMKRVFSFGLFLFVVNLSTGEEALSSKDFLKRVRRPRMISTWTKLKGYAQHKRDKIIINNKVIQKKFRGEAEIELGMLFEADSVIGEVLFDKNEHYEFSQVFSSGIEGSVSRKTGCRKGDTNVMNSFNISESDLSLSFLYWDFVKEHPSDSVSMQACRVLELKSEQNKEFVRVWIKPAWLAPLKAEWFKIDTDKPYRTAEFTAVKPIGDEISMIESFKIFGESWSTIVKFEDIKAAKVTDKAIPKDLFPKL